MALQRTAKTCGSDAPMLASSLREEAQMTVSNKPGHRGERVISRKAIAQGMSDCSPLPCMLVCAFFPIAHETAGAARIRHSLLPSFEGGCHAKTRTPRAAGTFTCVWSWLLKIESA